MAGTGTLERLQQYLCALSPRARAMLLSALERAALSGEEVTGGDLILQQLRHIVREQREQAPRIGNSARLFFKPLEPFLVDDEPEHRHPGRVARASLEMLWSWVRRDLLPDDAKILTDAVGEALLAGNEAKAERLVGAFQDRACDAITAILEDAAADETISQRMLAQIGTKRAGDDVETLRCVLKNRAALGKFAAKLPMRIADLAGDQLYECKRLIETTSAREDALFLYSLLMVMSRLSAPWQIIRFGIKAAGTAVAARVAETRYGIAVTIAIAELEREVGELGGDLRGGMAVGSSLKVVHDTMRGLRSEIALPVDSTWGRALAAQRKKISDLLTSKIESVPARLRTLLRARPSTEIAANSMLDAGEVARTEALVELAANCRLFADEFDIGERVQSTFSELQHYLDSATPALLDGLRHAGPADRDFRQSQVDAAVRFRARAFDAEPPSGKAAQVVGRGALQA
jgi:hypothetical protein